MVVVDTIKRNVTLLCDRQETRRRANRTCRDENERFIRYISSSFFANYPTSFFPVFWVETLLSLKNFANSKKMRKNHCWHVCPNFCFDLVMVSVFAC